MTREFSLIKILLKPEPKVILVSFSLLCVDLIGGIIYFPGQEPPRISLEFDSPPPSSVSDSSGPTCFAFTFTFGGSDQVNKIHKIQFFWFLTFLGSVLSLKGIILNFIVRMFRITTLSLQDEVLSSGFVFLMGRKFNKLDLIIDVIFMFNFANINRFYSLVRSWNWMPWLFEKNVFVQTITGKNNTYLVIHLGTFSSNRRQKPCQCTGPQWGGSQELLAGGWDGPDRPGLSPPPWRLQLPPDGPGEPRGADIAWWSTSRIMKAMSQYPQYRRERRHHHHFTGL